MVDKVSNGLKQQSDTNRIKELITIIYDSFETLKKVRDESKNELSNLDKELSNQYHKIEGIEFASMCDSHLLIMELKSILHDRREAKIKHTLLDSIISGLDNNLTKSKKRYEEIITKHEEIIKEIISRAK